MPNSQEIKLEDIVDVDVTFDIPGLLTLEEKNLLQDCYKPEDGFSGIVINESTPVNTTGITINMGSAPIAYRILNKEIKMGKRFIDHGMDDLIETSLLFTTTVVKGKMTVKRK